MRRSLLWVGIAAGAMLLVTAAILLLAPFVLCPDCDGTGMKLGDCLSYHGGECARCVGKSKISFYRRWTTKPEQTLVGAAEATDCSLYIGPLLSREKIPMIATSAMLGILEFSSDSPPHARRARELLDRDAREKHYKFWRPGGPNPWGPK